MTKTVSDDGDENMKWNVYDNAVSFDISGLVLNEI